MRCPSCGHEWRHLRAGLTARERQLVTFLEARDGVAPSYDEMLAATGLRSKNSINRLIHQLIIKGWVERTRRRARSVRLLPDVR